MRTARATPLCLPDRGTDGLLQLYRRLLQSYPTTLRPRISLAHLLRTGDANRPTVRHPLNRPRKRGNFSRCRCWPDPVLRRAPGGCRSWLPFLTVLCRSERANAKRRRRHQTVPEKAAWGMRLIARWFQQRRLVMVGDGAFASLELFRTLRCHALCVARCRMGARVFNPPPARKAGQKGRPRVIGTRQLTPRTRSARKATKWVRMTIPGWRTEDGTTDRPVDVATGRALWNARGITVPVRWVLTRDPAGRAETRVFVCSD